MTSISERPRRESSETRRISPFCMSVRSLPSFLSESFRVLLTVSSIQRSIVRCFSSAYLRISNRWFSVVCARGAFRPLTTTATTRAPRPAVPSGGRSAPAHRGKMRSERPKRARFASVTYRVRPVGHATRRRAGENGGRDGANIKTRNPKAWRVWDQIHRLSCSPPLPCAAGEPVKQRGRAG